MKQTANSTDTIVLYGAPWCPDCKQSKKFLSEHRVDFEFVDVDDNPEALDKVREIQNGGQSIPTIVFPSGEVLIEPSNEEIATTLGLQLAASAKCYDLLIIGGGPAGLTAAIYAAREGIESIVIDGGGLGGQAGVTERLDNYPGFPEGIGGGELADRFIAQAKKYGVELLSGVNVNSIKKVNDEVDLELSNGQQIGGHAAIIATGSTYKRLDVPGESELIGAGIHFCSTCDGPFYKGSERLAVIGGGNSATEESLFLTQFTDEIVILQFENSLTASSLLVSKVLSHPKIKVLTGVQVSEFVGDKKLREVVYVERDNGEIKRLEANGAFIFIGLSPNVGFLSDDIEKDKFGFVVADPIWQTSTPGIFVAGDVRSGSTKQLAGAVGEGATALLNVRRYLEAHHEMTHKQAG
ncbi:MAG: FAD-dependent oxidoreductase [Acidimicrobiales bacterium]|nr:FAD-dependent oxidoreductase [Acidimicrobiales bacterium]